MAAVYIQSTGKTAIILSVIALFAIINGVLIQLIMASRIFYGMASEGWLPTFLKRLHPTTKTPMMATVVAAFIILLLAVVFPILTLAKSTSFLIFIIFILVNMSLIKVKLRDPVPSDIKCYPLWIPIMAVIVNIAILGYQILTG